MKDFKIELRCFYVTVEDFYIIIIIVFHFLGYIYFKVYYI